MRRSVRKTETANASPRLTGKIEEIKEIVNEKERGSTLSESAKPPTKFGTQLSLSENSITKMLWTQDVDVIAMDEKDALSRKEQARTLVCSSCHSFTHNPKGNLFGLHALLVDNYHSLFDESSI